MSKIPLTVKGAEKLRAELQELKGVQRPAIITAIAEARSRKRRLSTKIAPTSPSTSVFRSPTIARVKSSRGPSA